MKTPIQKLIDIKKEQKKKSADLIERANITTELLVLDGLLAEEKDMLKKAFLDGHDCFDRPFNVYYEETFNKE